MARRLVGVRQPSTLHHGGNGRQLVELTSAATLLRRLTHELAATSAKSSTSEEEKTLEPESSAEEKRIISPTSAQGLLSTLLRQGILATCRTR